MRTLHAVELRVVFGSTATGVHLQAEAGLVQVDGYRKSKSPEAHDAHAPVRFDHPVVPALSVFPF